MQEKYTVANIRTYINDEELDDMLSSFSCPLNHDIERFLLNSSVEFTKKGQSVTYLVLSKNEFELAGYFSLAIKPVSIMDSLLSNSMRRKISRVSALNEETNTYTASAYLIAQLGKNFALPEDRRITGAELLNMARDVILDVKYSVGGIIEFVECEDKHQLLNFYHRNGFSFFGSRISQDNVKLNKLLRFI